MALPWRTPSNIHGVRMHGTQNESVSTSKWLNMKHNWKPHIYHFTSSDQPPAPSVAATIYNNNMRNVIWPSLLWRAILGKICFCVAVCCAAVCHGSCNISLFVHITFLFFSFFAVVHELDLTKGRSYVRPLWMSWCWRECLIIIGCVRGLLGLCMCVCV